MAAIAAATSGLALAALDPRLAEAARDAARGVDEAERSTDRSPGDDDGAMQRDPTVGAETEALAARGDNVETREAHTAISAVHADIGKDDLFHEAVEPMGAARHAPRSAAPDALGPPPVSDEFDGVSENNGGPGPAQQSSIGAVDGSDPGAEGHGMASSAAEAAPVSLASAISGASDAISQHADRIVEQLDASLASQTNDLSRTADDLVGATLEGASGIASDLTTVGQDANAALDGALQAIPSVVADAGQSAAQAVHDVAGAAPKVGEELAGAGGEAADRAGSVVTNLAAPAVETATAAIGDLSSSDRPPAETVDDTAGLARSVIDIPNDVLGGPDDGASVAGIPAETLGGAPTSSAVAVDAPALAATPPAPLAALDGVGHVVDLGVGDLQLGFLGESYAQTPDLQDGALSSGLHGLI